VRTDGALAKRLGGFAEEIGALRKEIVATKEGGAITGEERLREHLDYAYGALVSYEGRPGDYQIARVATLERELADVDDRATKLLQTRLPSLNDALKRKGLETIAEASASELGAQLAARQLWSQAHEEHAASAATRGVD